MYYEYADELLLHVRELVELENGINFTGNAEIAIILSEEELEEFMENAVNLSQCRKLYIAIITILVSADNHNIQELKNTLSNEKHYHSVNGKQLSLFQILLSNIAYNIICETVYLIFLIAVALTKSIFPLQSLKYVSAICIFVILHILLVLLESVAQMYLTFWDKK